MRITINVIDYIPYVMTSKLVENNAMHGLFMINVKLFS